MLRISKLADYATVLMSIFASSPQKLLSANTISQRSQIAVPTVSKILKLLHEAGLVSSIRGANGGYQLAKSAEEISIFDVIRAIDGKPVITECSKGRNICEHDQVCGVRHHWQTINAVISQFLASFSLADITKPHTKDFPIHFYAKPNLAGRIHDKK